MEHVSCSPYKVEHVSCSPYKVEHVTCSPYKVEHVSCGSFFCAKRNRQNSKNIKCLSNLRNSTIRDLILSLCFAHRIEKCYRSDSKIL